MLLWVVSRKSHSPTRRSPVGPSPREGVGALQLVQLLIDTSVPPRPPQRPRGEAREAEPRRPRQGRQAGQAGPTRQATAARGAQDIRAHEAGSSQPRATPEPSHHGAQASSSRGTAGQQQPPRQSRTPSINRELFPTIHPPITSRTTPSPSHSGARARTQGNPSRATRTERRQGRQTRGARSPAARARRTEEERTASEHDSETRATPTAAQAQEDRARRPSMPSGPEPKTTSARDADQERTRGHQRPQEPRTAGRPPETAAARRRAAGGRTRAQGAKPTNLREEQKAHKRRRPAALARTAGPLVSAVCAGPSQWTPRQS